MIDSTNVERDAIAVEGLFLTKNNIDNICNINKITSIAANEYHIHILSIAHIVIIQPIKATTINISGYIYQCFVIILIVIVETLINDLKIVQKHFL